MLDEPIKELNRYNKNPRLIVTNSTNKLHSNNMKKYDFGQKLYSGYCLDLEKFNRAVGTKPYIDLSRRKGKLLDRQMAFLKYNKTSCREKF